MIGGEGSVRRDVFGSATIASCCLEDEERTGLFARAVATVVRPGDRVIELGTGTGVLAMLAARAGAAHVDAFEIAEPLALAARANVLANGLDDVVHIHAADVTLMSATVTQPYDVVIAEMITTALVEEELVPACNNLVDLGVLRPDVRAIPYEHSTTVELVEFDAEAQGITFPSTVWIQESWQRDRVNAVLAGPIALDTVQISAALRSGTHLSTGVDVTVAVRVSQAGQANAVRLASVSHLAPGIDCGWTQCINSPVVRCLPAPVKVAAGDDLSISVRYDMGAGLETLQVAVVSD